MMKLESADDWNILFYAFLYALTSNTTAPAILVAELKRQWPEMPRDDRWQIHQKICWAASDGGISTEEYDSWGEILELPLDDAGVLDPY